MLTPQAFNALLKTLEEPPKNVIFILATTEVHKVLDTIKSRCQRFDFRRITTDDIVKHLRYISDKEKINISDDALFTIAKNSAGGMRDSISLLDQLSLLGASKEVTSEDVNSILGRISSITGHYEDLMNIIVDIDTLYPDFKEYYDVYQEEQRKKVVSEGIDSVVVKAFKASLDPRWRFVLENTEMITLKRGDVHLVHGQTGCGKSTLLTTLTGGLFPENSPIQFSNGDSGYLNSLTYQTDRAMANNFVINEISLNDGDDIDIFKILEILKGLCLYDEILMMIKGTEFEKENVSDEEKVISFIRAKRVREFSSGQMQRLALAKLLYQLDDSIQMVALDEPFNRLDDETTVKCAEFVIGYIMRNPRIVILATHQVSQCKPFCNKEICFRTELNKSFLVAK
jgi:DNA polymerase III delta prime subunit